MLETDPKLVPADPLTGQSRIWMAGRVALVTFICTLLSGSLCYLTYWILGWENFNDSVPLLMPIVAPLLITPLSAFLILRYTSIISAQRRELAELSATLRQARDEAIAATEAKSSYVAMISHEIRTPLGGMRGLTELIQRDPSSDRSKDFLGMLLSTTDALLDLLNSILDSAKIDAGKLDLNETHVSLHDFQDQLAGLWQHALGSKSVGFALEKPDKDFAIVIDDFRCRQILNNFLSNAIKFTEEGRVTLGANLDKTGSGTGKLHLYVKDTGIGITQDQIPLLFEEFEQTDKSISALHGGSGLGLNISRKLAELMGGTIHVESAPGEGSRFTLELDVALAAAPAVSASA